ncbi:MAG: LAGLIDADG family homing endonuclease, partial [Nitrospira sp.]
MPAYKKVNKDFFKKWSPEMAYVSGFFAADGYITVNKRGGQFWCVDIADQKLIEEIKRVIHSEHKISLRKRKGGKYLSYRLQIGSGEMCDDLRKIGYDERKTKRLRLPNIPDKYFSYFVRGYFDGDGNVWVGLMHKSRKTHTLSIQTVFTSCSSGFLEHLKENLKKFDMERGVIRKGKGDYYRLTYSVFNSLKLYDFMY